MEQSGSHYHVKFIQEIKRHSKVDDYKEACAMWEFSRIVDPGVAGTCICSHQISVDYIVRNKKTGQELTIGSDCIDNFFDNDEVKAEAKLAAKNRKRTMQGKSEAIPCKFCGKTVPQLANSRRLSKQNYHKKCQTNNFYKRLKEEKEEWKRSYVTKIPQIQSLFSELKSNPAADDRRGFLDDIENYFHINNCLSEKQEKALVKIYKKVTGNKKFKL